MTEQQATAVIRTPDQRLRVFVSSTLQELLPERQAAKAAVRRLHLSPVMFELGARPHPPRELYRAYLEQSHVFVGIYWERYGWVAPGEQVSGLEDEYLLSGDRPKLIYVKAPADKREPRLGDLLDRVRSDDRASYKPFGNAAELQRLLVEDLALLLTEHFEAATAARSPAAAEIPAPDDAVPHRPRWPRPATSLIGRTAELESLAGLIEGDDIRLITLVGPGGIGKTRLALAAGQAMADHGEARFVGLADLDDPAQVIPAVATAYDVPETETDRLDGIARALAGHRELLVLDNAEHLIAAAADVGALVEACPDLTVLVTSRAPLRLVAEYEMPVPPLQSAAPDADLAELQASEAVQLFVSRAQNVRRGFSLTAANAPAIAKLAYRLDGLPLAIELAAGWTKLLTPGDLLDRLDDRFELLEGGDRDLPTRHRTLRATIDWSFELLEVTEQRVLLELGVFAGGFTIPAAEAVCDPEGTIDLLDPLSTLVDHNLVVSRDAGEGIRLGLLESIRAYALDRLASNGAAQPVRDRHAAYFLAYAEKAKSLINGPQQQVWLARLEADHENLRAALAFYAEEDDVDALARLALALTYFWWIRGHLVEAETWLTEAVRRLPDDHPARGAVLKSLGVIAYVQGDYAAARASYEQARPLLEATGDQAELASVTGNLGIVAMEERDYEGARPLLEEALDHARALGEPATVGPALINLGLLRVRLGDLERARADLEEAVRIHRALNDSWRLNTALLNLGEALLVQGDVHRARSVLDESLLLGNELGDLDSVAFGLEASGSVAAAAGDPDLAARLWGGAEQLRERIRTPRPPTSAVISYDADVARMRDSLGAGAFAAAWAEGGQASREEIIALARQALMRPTTSAFERGRSQPGWPVR